MKERPILFSAPMVRAILDGRKTQTRRVVKLQTPKATSISDFCVDGIRVGRCPYGQPGDRLWVRETWAYGIHAMAAARDEDGPFVYAADGTTQGRLCERWRPSIHMPRRAGRITLEVIGVRVERLQDISESDAVAEGIERGEGFPGWYRYSLPGDSLGLTEVGKAGKCPTAFPRLAYRALWERINGLGSWDVDPWVWVVEFKRVEMC